MIVISILPALLTIAGLLVYVLASQAKVVEVGRIAFFVGLLTLALALSAHVVKLGAL